ncbi:MAG TPA: hypothetical protein VGF67_22605 [Ktedonobacteraceae bacterium]
MSTRNATLFYPNDTFIVALNQLDVPVAASVNAHLLHFENVWRASKHDGDIPAGFFLEIYHGVEEPYRLYQIRVGPGHSYRVVIMFLDRGAEAYWVHIFKKVKDRQPADMQRAHLHAQWLWDKLQRRNDHGT